MSKIDLVTIARQFGAGGGDLAQALSQSLGWPVLDREIIHDAAARLHADEARATSVDEYVASALSKIAKGFALGLPEYAIEPAYEVDPDDVARATHEVIRAAAKSTPLIIVGHGVQCVFASRPGSLHVRVVAPVEKRAACIAERSKMELAAATTEVQQRDTQRARYLRHHFGCDNNDPMLYDAQFNTAHLSVAEVASAITEIVQVRQRV
ncbi:MAG: Cytidylate kinaselike family [Myxococcaceae bacterium]|jgi:cytidylate kinase|nr:Cytidylate kinaselike family [Myxococcaceae bacterium]